MFAGSEIDRKTNESLADLKRGFGAGKINFSGHQNDIGNTPVPKSFLDRHGDDNSIKIDKDTLKNLESEQDPDRDAANLGLSVLTGILGAPTGTQALIEIRQQKEQAIQFQRQQEFKPAIMPEQQKPTHTHPIYTSKKSGPRPNGI